MYAGAGARPQQPQFGNAYGGGYGGQQALGGAYGQQGSPYAAQAAVHQQANQGALGRQAYGGQPISSQPYANKASPYGSSQAPGRPEPAQQQASQQPQPQAPPQSFPANPAPAAAKPPVTMPATSMAPTIAPVVPSGPSQREQVLEQKNRELEQIIAMKDRELDTREREIKELQQQLNVARTQAKNAGGKEARTSPRGIGASQRNSLQIGSGDARPLTPYQGVAPDDDIDSRLEEFYNKTGSSIPFRRINRGFYRFGETIVELSLINHKLMSRTEDGWNRGKFGAIDRFMKEYEILERDKAGIEMEG